MSMDRPICTSTWRATTTLVTSPVVMAPTDSATMAAKASSVDRGLILTTRGPGAVAGAGGTGGHAGWSRSRSPADRRSSSRSPATTVSHSRPSASRP